MVPIFSTWGQISGVTPHVFPSGGTDLSGTLDAGQTLDVFGVESTNLTWVWVVISSDSVALGVEMGLTERPGLHLPSMLSVLLPCVS